MTESLQRAITKLSSLPLDLLGAKELQSLQRSVEKASLSIQKAQNARELARIENQIPLEDRRCFLEIRKQYGPVRQQTARQLEAAVARCQSVAGRYRPIITDLKRIGEAEAMQRIAGFSAEDRHWISLLANVPNERGGLRKLTASRKNHVEWRRALQVR